MGRLLAVLLVALLVAGSLPAAEAPPPAPREADAAPPAAPQPPEALPAPAPTFTPSEKISADSAVAFPVDI